MHRLITPFQEALVAMDQLGCDTCFAQALTEGPPLQAVETLVVPALAALGEAWSAGDVALSQVYMAGRYCEQLVERVLPASDPDRKRQPRSAIVVLSDYHDLGKRIVYSVLRASGYEVFDYGRMDPEPLVERALNERIRVLMISVLMLPSALRAREVCTRLHALAPGIRVLVGGAPFLFDAQLWQEIGADAMGANAAQAVAQLQHWMDEPPV